MKTEMRSALVQRPGGFPSTPRSAAITCQPSASSASERPRASLRAVAPALAFGLAVFPSVVAWADPSVAPATAAKAATPEPSASVAATPPRVGAALGDLKTADVRKLQSALRQAGHYRGELDGVAGPATQAALAAFQRTQVSDGSVLDPTTQKAFGMQVEASLASSSASAQTDVAGEAAVAAPPVADSPSAPAVPSAARSAPATTHPNGDPAPAKVTATGRVAAETVARTVEPQAPSQFALVELTRVQLERLQERLRTLGHYQGPIDGLDGPRTRQAFRDFFNHQLGLMTNQVELTREGALALGVDLTASEPAVSAVLRAPPRKVAASAVPAPPAVE